MMLILFIIFSLTRSLWIRPDTNTLRSPGHRSLRHHTCIAADSPSQTFQQDTSPRSAVQCSRLDTDRHPSLGRRGHHSHTCTAAGSPNPSACRHRLQRKKKNVIKLWEALWNHWLDMEIGGVSKKSLAFVWRFVTQIASFPWTRKTRFFLCWQ